MEENYDCVICGESNDQMLVLACQHDPCINCAAIAYEEDRRITRNSTGDQYTCRICQTKTTLDPPTVSFLEKLAPRGTNKKKAEQKTPYNNKYDVYPVTLPTSKKQYPASSSSGLSNNRRRAEQDSTQIDLLKQIPKPKSIPKRTIKNCKEHPEEQITYYCFKCYENICPECAIHGSHHSHEVKSTKKAIGDIRKQFGDLLQKVERTQLQHRKGRDMHQRNIKELSEQTTRQKALIAKEFDMLRGALLSKEKQIIKEIEEIHQRNVSLLNTQIELILRQSEQAALFGKGVEAILNKDELTILDEFGKKKEAFNIEIEKYTASLAGPRASSHQGLTGLKTVNLNDIKQMVIRLVQQLTSFRLQGAELSLPYTWSNYNSSLNQNSAKGYVQQQGHSAQRVYR